MRLLNRFAFASVSLAALSVPAFAQEAPSSEGIVNEDIIVQARRRDESLQDVPLTVNAVSAATIEKLNIRDLKDITAVVPGLVLNPGNRTTGVVASLRGLNVDVNSSGANTSVQFYLNDSLISAGAVLQSLYDIGQVEVLRGPQGTLRGIASPSGSITITTKRPVMDKWGGYAQGTATTFNSYNANAAVNVPIIKDVLAVRVAGLFEDNEANRIHSIVSPAMLPSSRTRAIRASVRFTPTSNIEVNASYNRLVKNFVIFDQVESAQIANPALALTGPPATSTFVTARDRLAVENVANVGRQAFDIFNWQAQWSFAGQRLNYVGSFVRQNFGSTEPYDKGDYFGTTVGGDGSLSNNNGSYVTAPATLNPQNVAQATRSNTTQETHELRLSSEERLFGTFDYVAGLFVTKQVPWTDLVRPGSVNITTNRVNTSLTQRRGRTIERAVFGNLTAHLGERTEVSGGIRFINYKTSTNNSSAAVPFGTSDTYKATVWSASVKHRFNDNLMVYGTAGTSFRVGSGTNGLILLSSGLTTGVVDPYLAGLFPNTPERSKSYEIGVRSNWLDNRLTANISAFHQTFDGYIFPAAAFYVLKNPGNLNPVPTNDESQVVRTVSGVAVPVPVKIDGIEAELAFRASDHFDLSASVAYAKAKIINGVVPCVFTTKPLAATINVNGTTQVAQCGVNQSASRSSPFSATVQGEYNLPVTDNLNGFVRGLLQFYGNSTNDAQNPYDDVPAYALMNLYAGVRSDDGRWEVTGYVKNLFNTFRVTSRDSSAQLVSVQTGAAAPFASSTGISNYRLVTVTDPREFGITARFAFGSR